MLFNSFPFLIFCAVFFCVWPFVRGRAGARWGFIVLASFLFYGWWDWRYLSLLLVSGYTDYVAAILIEDRPRHRKLWLALSMAGNLGTLVFFKYLDFMISNFNSLASLWGGTQVPLVNLVLPVGISFYTFASMSYTIDVYRGELRATRKLTHFFAFLSLFPHLVAGPILRARDLLPQLLEARAATDDERWNGLKCIAGGFFKKVVIADNLAPIVSSAFSSASVYPSSLYWWVVISMFAFQIYCDFSGYSDIARGLAQWMGYRFPLNFDHPYVSRSLREFWTRWHVSLSTWFRDYVYIPIGGGEGSALRSHVNMWIAMMVSGLWHGASWTFIAWGALHAFYLSLERLTRWPSVFQGTVGRYVATALVVFQVWIAWVFFRAESFSQALSIVGRLLSFQGSDLTPLLHVPNANLSLLCFGMILLREGFAIVGEMPTTPRWRQILEPVAITLLLLMSVFLRGPEISFIYFQF